MVMPAAVNSVFQPDPIESIKNVVLGAKKIAQGNGASPSYAGPVTAALIAAALRDVPGEQVAEALIKIAEEK